MAFLNLIGFILGGTVAILLAMDGHYELSAINAILAMINIGFYFARVGLNERLIR